MRTDAARSGDDELATAVGQYVLGEVSLGRAAEIAGVSRWEFEEILEDAGFGALYGPGLATTSTTKSTLRSTSSRPPMARELDQSVVSGRRAVGYPPPTEQYTVTTDLSVLLLRSEQESGRLRPISPTFYRQGPHAVPVARADVPES